MDPEKDLEREKYEKTTFITPGLDMVKLKDKDNVIGRYQTETTVF